MASDFTKDNECHKKKLCLQESTGEQLMIMIKIVACRVCWLSLRPKKCPVCTYLPLCVILRYIRNFLVWRRPYREGEGGAQES